MTLAFLALLGAPYIYDISSLRVNYSEERLFEKLIFSLLTVRFPAF